MTEVADGPWNAVLVRPLSVAQVADKIAALLALAPSAGEGVPPMSCRDPSTAPGGDGIGFALAMRLDGRLADVRETLAAICQPRAPTATA